VTRSIHEALDAQPSHTRRFRSMLADHPRQPFITDDTDPLPDHSMLVLQYATAMIAVIAAFLLTGLR